MNTHMCPTCKLFPTINAMDDSAAKNSPTLFYLLYTKLCIRVLLFAYVHCIPLVLSVLCCLYTKPPLTRNKKKKNECPYTVFCATGDICPLSWCKVGFMWLTIKLSSLFICFSHGEGST